MTGTGSSPLQTPGAPSAPPRRRPVWRRLGLALVAVAVLLLAIFLVRSPSFGLGLGIGSGDGEDGGGLRVHRGDLVVTTEVEGTLESVDSELLGPPNIPSMWNYKLSYMAPEGSDVQAGQPVLRFDTTELQRRLLEKTAERDSAETELEKKEIDLARKLRDMELQLARARATLERSRLKVEVPGELQSAKELEEARLDLALAEREVASLEDRLELTRRAGEAEVRALREKRDRAEERVGEINQHLARMTVQASRDGTVVYVTDWRGEKKKVGDDVWQALKVIEIPDLTRMQAKGQVDEADAGRVAVGQPVTLRLDAHPETEYSARIASIARSVGQKDRGNPLKHVELTLELEETDVETMRPGMRFQGEIEVERAEDVLLAPAAAVVSTADGPVAFRRGLFGVKKVEPEVGRRNDEVVEIEAGLAAGDLLVRPEEGME